MIKKIILHYIIITLTIYGRRDVSDYWLLNGLLNSL